MDAEPVQQVDQVLRKPDTYGHIADGVFQDQVPTDDPGDEFSHCGVGIGVRAARNRNHRGEFGVAHRRESTSNGDENKGEGNRRAGAGASKRSRMMNQIFEKRRVQDGRGLKFLSGNCRADDGKNAGADDRADAERRQAQPPKGLF